MYTNLIVLLFLIFSLQMLKMLKLHNLTFGRGLIWTNGQLGLVKFFLSVKKVVQTLHVWFETKLHNLVWLSFNKFQGLQK